MSDLKKIKPWLYEIPKTGGMRVPGRIYASPELMESQKVDEAVEQVRNVAHLPGIVGYSLAMPDFHWGYGFPIGGVAAFDEDEGVVSPGGVGFDINCLIGSTPVLFPEGYTRPIRDLVERRISSDVVLFDRKRRLISSSRVVAGVARAPRSPVWELLTRSGRTIVATEDHPFLTPFGMRKVGTLIPGSRIASLPFEGIPYEPPTDETIVGEREILRAAARIGKDDRGLGLTQALAHLHPLLPLTYSHAALPVLLKVAGYVLGDGSIHFDHGCGKGHVSVNGQKRDMERMRRDLRPWVPVSRVYSRHRKHSIPTLHGLVRTESTEHFVHINSTGFALLLSALGIPVGPKATQDWELPPFLEKAPVWQQRLFLAGFFGAELSTPKAFKKTNYNFYCPTLVAVKRKGFVESGVWFLGGIARMLKRMGVDCLTISRRDEQMNPDGRRSIRLRLIISDRTENLIHLWGNVGFEYNEKRSRLAREAVGYLRQKAAFVATRDLLCRRILKIRASSGWGAKKILAAVAGVDAPVNLRFVQRTIYEPRERTFRATQDFPTLGQWRREWVKGGLVWEEILAKTPRPDVRRVYDITVGRRSHTFVANGFVVHNCGVRLIRTGLDRSDVQPRIRDLVANIFRAIPAGVGSDGAIPTPKEGDALAIVTQGAKWAVDHGYGTPDDLEHIEDGGLYPGADPKAVSDRAFKRGMPQVGTLGSGNHFLEIQVVDRIYRKDVAQHFALKEGTVCFSIHSGSRGFGYQVCEDNLKAMIRASEHYGIALPDRQLCSAPLGSPEGRQYLSAMACAANFAWVNRQVMTALTRRVFARTLGVSEESLGARLIYDVCHNIAKMEEHGGRRLCVHRKGATRAFGPGHPLLPAAFRELGQPTFIPGDMGRASFLLVGKEGSMKETFGSTCHGAGRAHSRTAMKKMMQGRNLFRELEGRGVIVMAHGRDSVAEEMPEAYKDASLVVDVMEQAGITDKVARLIPIGCIKG